MALKLFEEVAYDKAFSTLTSKTPESFNNKECFKQMSEKVLAKSLASKGNFVGGQHVSVIHTGCGTENNTSITYKFEVSENKIKIFM